MHIADMVFSEGLRRTTRSLMQEARATFDTQARHAAVTSSVVLQAC